MQPKVSVLIPTHNRPQLLADALASVIAQDFRDFEVIVRDDAGSVGEVETVLQQIGDKRIKYQKNEYNIGDYGTNVALYAEARGQYLAHLDDDDLWRPDFLARLVRALDDNPDCGLAFSNHQVIDPHGKILPDKTRHGNVTWGRAELTKGRHLNGRSLAAVARAIPVSHSAVVRAETLNLDHFRHGEPGHAWDMYIAALSVRETGCLWFEVEPLSFYRWGHSDQLSTRPSDDATFEGLVWTLRALAADPHFRHERPALLSQLTKQNGRWALHTLLRKKQPLRAIPLISRTMRDAMLSSWYKTNTAEDRLAV